MRFRSPTTGVRMVSAVRIAWVFSLMGLGACGAGSEELAVATTQQTVFECASPQQRFACAAPADPAHRFVCHANHHDYVKLEVPAKSAHQPGVAHGNNPPDQAPGASATDTGAGALDCECNPRQCATVCTGAPDGAACDDGDLCTGDGVCANEVCEPGAPSCEAGDPVDACTLLSGACDSA